MASWATVLRIMGDLPEVDYGESFAVQGVCINEFWRYDLPYSKICLSLNINLESELKFSLFYLNMSSFYIHFTTALVIDCCGSVGEVIC